MFKLGITLVGLIILGTFKGIKATPSGYSVIEANTGPATDEEIRTALVVNQLLLEQLGQRMLDMDTTEQKPDCPYPFVNVNLECFYVSQKVKMSWEEAKNFCQELGGHLAEPENMARFQIFVQEKLGLKTTHFYLGASDLTQEGRWKWISGKPLAVNDTAWRSREPNSDGNEDCLLFVSTYYPSLADVECHRKEGFVCEYSPNA